MAVKLQGNEAAFFATTPAGGLQPTISCYSYLPMESMGAEGA